MLTHTRIGLAVAVVILLRVGHRLRTRLGELPEATRVSAQMTSRATFFGLLQAAGAVCRHYWPVALLLALISPRFRRIVIEIAIAEGVVEWIRSVAAEPAVAPTMGPFGYLLCRRLDDLAYGTGLWQGVVTHRDLAALRPVLTP